MLTSVSGLTLPLFSYCHLRPDKHLDFSQVNHNKMALCTKPSGGFAVLPREVRDMICWQIASAAGIRVKLYHHYELHLSNKDYVVCIKTLHDSARKSSIAQVVFEEILTAAQFIRQWAFKSEFVINYTTIPLIMRSYGPIVDIDVSSGTLIDLRDCVRDLELDVRYHRLKACEKDQRDFSDLELGLTQLPQLPHLRRIRLTVWIPSYIDVYHMFMPLVERTSSTIKQLKKRLGDNMSISISRDFMHLMNSKDFVDSYDVGWMWDPPSFTSEDDTESDLVAVEQRIKRLIADGVDPNGALTLVEELRAAADRLPQSKDDIVRMDAWSVGSGITKEKWLEIKKTWRRPS